jgi:hypothetical protein
MKIAPAKHLALAFVVGSAIVTSSPIALAGSWPRLAFGNETPQCRQALEVATISFNSIDPEIGPSAVVPDNLELMHLSDQGYFDAIPRPYIPESGDDSFRTIYWATTPFMGNRIVVREDPSGWQYETFSVYVIGADVGSEAFVESMRRPDSAKSKFSPIIRDRSGLLIVQSKQSSSLWIADTGALFEFLPDWRIFVAGPHGPKYGCKIQFRPNVKSASSLLPIKVRQFLKLLDQTIGPGIDEGSLQQTVSLRTKVSRSIANAALRPWAAKEPYNTRREVDEGLEAWSRRSSSYRNHYNRIQEQYPIAQQSLANYYEKQLQLPSEEARSRAESVLDIVFRTHYMFHRE